MSNESAAKRWDVPTVLRIAAESARHPDTVRRVLSGGGNAHSIAAVIAAAERLKIALPPNLAERAPLNIRAT